MMTTRFDGGVHVKLHRVCAGLEDWSSGFGEIGWAGFSSGTHDQVPLRQNHSRATCDILHCFSTKTKRHTESDLVIVYSQMHRTLVPDQVLLCQSRNS